MKYRPLIFLAFLVLLTSCNPYNIVRNDLTGDFSRAKYGMALVKPFIYMLTEIELTKFLTNLKEPVLKDNNLTKQEKNKKIKNIDSFEWQENQQIKFGFWTYGPVPKKYLNLNFQIAGKDITRYRTIQEVYKTAGGITRSVNYLWLITLEKPYTKGNYGEDPPEFTAIFPNNKKVTFKVKYPKEIK